MSIPNNDVEKTEIPAFPKVTVRNMANQISMAFLQCLFREGEDTTKNVRVEGITSIFHLHPERLEEQRELIKACLEELPPIFKEGYSFLKLCENKDGDQWTGMHKTCQELMVMAVGLDLMSYCLPREVWPALPGGVPYVIINK